MSARQGNIRILEDTAGRHIIDNQTSTIAEFQRWTLTVVSFFDTVQ
ncbi:MAG: hypothetical protein OXC13_19020 [Caldilineaceae bacterium]|nr:hypothetical protein [Caldilineaceae bacterium]